MNSLIIAEHNHDSLKSSTYHAISAATLLGGEIDLFIAGLNAETAAKEASEISCLRDIFLLDNEIFAHQLAEPMAEFLKEFATKYDYIIAPATTFGKNLLPRLAGLLNVSMISDVIKIIAADTFQRPIYAGNALATIQSNEKIKLLTIRTTSFDAIKKDCQPKNNITKLSSSIKNEMSAFVSQELTESKRPELTAAKIIVSGGRGLKSAENFKAVEEIADLLGAGVGASRAAVDAGFAPNDYQIGQTGKVVAPDLYLAIGISGAIQHLAGMKDSKVIVAINQDADAPIFQIADYGLVGDLFKILPELKDALKTTR